jgi:hypothetical protein
LEQRNRLFAFFVEQFERYGELGRVARSDGLSQLLENVAKLRQMIGQESGIDLAGDFVDERFGGVEDGRVHVDCSRPGECESGDYDRN